MMYFIAFILMKLGVWDPPFALELEAALMGADNIYTGVSKYYEKIILDICIGVDVFFIVSIVAFLAFRFYQAKKIIKEIDEACKENTEENYDIVI